MKERRNPVFMGKFFILVFFFLFIGLFFFVFLSFVARSVFTVFWVAYL